MCSFLQFMKFIKSPSLQYISLLRVKNYFFHRYSVIKIYRQSHSFACTDFNVIE